MRFLTLAILFTVVFSSQTLALSSSGISLPLCKNMREERLNKRLLLRHRSPRCISHQKNFSSSSSLTFSSSSSLSSSASSTAFSYDQIQNTAVRSQFLLLGETGPAMALISFFMEQEALQVTKVMVTVNSLHQSIQSFLVYDETKRYLGRASLTSTTPTSQLFTLEVPSTLFSLPRRTETRLYVRPEVLHKDVGGQSGISFMIDSVGVEGFGEWSSEKYTKLSTETFQPFVTSRSTMTNVQNILASEDILLDGMQQKVAGFTFEGRKSDSRAVIEVTSLLFQIESTGGATISNVKLRADNSSDFFPCTQSASLVTCGSIPKEIGSLTDGQRTIFVYGDVVVPLSSSRASLRLTLNQSGLSTSPGAVQWFDGETSFNWVALDSPIARGTLWKR